MSSKERFPKLYRKWRMTERYFLDTSKRNSAIIFFSFIIIALNLLGIDPFISLTLAAVNAIILLIQIPAVFCTSSEVEELISLNAPISFILNTENIGMDVRADRAVEYLMENYPDVAEFMCSRREYRLVEPSGCYQTTHMVNAIVNAIVVGYSYQIYGNILKIQIPTAENIRQQIDQCTEIVENNVQNMKADDEQAAYAKMLEYARKMREIIGMC